MTLDDLTPQEVDKGLKDNTILLVDVREPHEYAAERIHGALLHSLSTFEPKAMPVGGPRRVVLHCGSGKRSAKAAELAQAAGVNVDAHMAAGMQGWKGAGLPTVSVDPATGQVVDPSKG